MAAWLASQGRVVNRKRVRRPMRLAGLVAIYQRPNTSKPAAAHKIYPYLLGGIAIERVNQVWCADVTYIPMARGFLYLVVIMDWVSRAVLAWRLSNTLGAAFCVEALEEALSRHGRPEIFNTDQRRYGASGEGMAPSSLQTNRRGCPMPQANDLSRCLTALDQDSTLIAVIEMSQSSWLVAGMLPGVERQPLKKLAAAETALLGLLHRWRDEATKAGRTVSRIVVPPFPGLRGRPGWLLAGAVAAGARYRSPCDPRNKCRGVARASAGEDRPARHRVAEAGRLSRLAARRTGSLQHGRDPDT